MHTCVLAGLLLEPEESHHVGAERSGNYLQGPPVEGQWARHNGRLSRPRSPRLFHKRISSKFSIPQLSKTHHNVGGTAVSLAPHTLVFDTPYSGAPILTKASARAAAFSTPCLSLRAGRRVLYDFHTSRNMGGRLHHSNAAAWVTSFCGSPCSYDLL